MKVVLVGHSHIQCLARALKRYHSAADIIFATVQLRDAVFSNTPDSVRFAPASYERCNQQVVARHIAEITAGVSLTVVCPTGNEHTISSLSISADTSPEMVKDNIYNMMNNYRLWLEAITRQARSPMVILPPPPPIESAEFIRENPGNLAEKIETNGVAPAWERLSAWQYQQELIAALAEGFGQRVLTLPAEVFSENGFLQECFIGRDSSHGNEAYGRLILDHLTALAADPAFIAACGRPQKGRDEHTPAPAPATEVAHPYAQLPDRAFWKQAVAQVPAAQFDPVADVPFCISPVDRVATAGSCFAQHISKRIRAAGFHFLVTEQPAEAGGGEERGFYDFSARYGNIYTARQLLQLFDRAFGYFTPLESCWELPGGRCCDPFRPRIEPDGFPSAEALTADRERHLQAVREMFLSLDIFVFTLGLTECWLSRLDGAAYPVAPGVAGGTYDPERYRFVNFSVDEVVADLQAFIHKLRLVNPRAKLILTVSPVPLTATYEPQNVLVATTYSKAVLRVAAETLTRTLAEVCYFPSFEIITGNFNRGSYFGPDLRSVTTEGVDHVMTVFMRHLTEGSATTPAPRDSAAELDLDPETREMLELAEAACDDELLERD